MKMECRALPKNALKNSEGFRKAVEILRPHWPDINRHMENNIREYAEFLEKDSSKLERIIKCHLISEIYLDRYLSHKLSLTNLTDAGLTYRQKALLLPEADAAATFVKPGLLKLNSLRNSFAHNLDFTFSKRGLGAMTTLLILSERPASTMNAIEIVEKFTALSCAYLNPTPPKIEDLFANAMKHVAVEDSSRR